MLLDPDASPEAADRYARYFSARRLRRLSRRRRGGPHGDLWQALTVVLRALGGDGLPHARPARARRPVRPRRPAARRAGQRAGRPPARVLARQQRPAHRDAPPRWIHGKAGRVQPVDYRNLGAEELGSVYESLLELVPRIDPPSAPSSSNTSRGTSARPPAPTTPRRLVERAARLRPGPAARRRTENAVDNADAVRRLLALTVCDPACGSGHFLVAAARRIASGSPRCAPATRSRPRRRCSTRCARWSGAASTASTSTRSPPSWPRCRCGWRRWNPANRSASSTPTSGSATACSAPPPRCWPAGVPDEAFKELEGDDKKIAAATRKRNKQEREGQFGAVGERARPDPTPIWPNDEPSSSRSPTALTEVQVAGLRLAAIRIRRPPADDPADSGRRLVRRLRLEADAGRPRGADLVDRPRLRKRPRLAAGPTSVPRSPAWQRSTDSSTGTWSSRRSSRWAETVQLNRRRLDRRLHLRARQPAVGTGQAAGAGVLRRPRPGDRDGAEQGRPPDG